MLRFIFFVWNYFLHDRKFMHIAYKYYVYAVLLQQKIKLLIFIT